MASNGMPPPPRPTHHITSSPPLSALNYFPSSQAHAGHPPPLSQGPQSLPKPETHEEPEDVDGGVTDGDMTASAYSQEDPTQGSLEAPVDDDTLELPPLELGRGSHEPDADDRSSRSSSVSGADRMQTDFHTLQGTGGDGAASKVDGNDGSHQTHNPNHVGGEDDRDAPDEPFVERYEWEDLYQRYTSEMDQKRTEEQHTMQRYEQLQLLYSIWAAKGAEQEETRAAKRLCTRMEHVQHSETDLKTKRDHREQVVKAFESAMRLFD